LSAYRVDRELGRGGMAVVYAGRQEDLDRPVALKVLAAHLAGDQSFRKRFLREARIAAALDHPNVVRTFDVTELEGLPCIVMELLSGETLEGGRLTRDEAAQVAAAVAYAHGRGVVHRDLKPSNLLRGTAGEVKIADFGVAHAAAHTSLTEVGTILGTLGYVAPEQAEGRVVGPAADVYSLGVLLRELAPDVDRALVERCLARDPAARPRAAEVAAELHGVRHRLVSDTRSKLLELHAFRRRLVHGVRHRVVSDTSSKLVAAGAVVAALLAAGAVFLLTRHGPAPATIPPVPHASTPAAEARNLESWLRRYSR